MPAMAMFSPELETDQLGDVTVVRFVPPHLMDPDQTEDVGRQLVEIVQQGKRRLVLDFRNVERVSSGLVAKVIGLHKRVQAEGGRLAVCNLSPPIQDVFVMLRLPQFLHLYDRDTDALQSF